MANKSIQANKLRQLLRLFNEGHTKMFISKMTGLSRNTINKYIGRLRKVNIPEQDILSLDDKGLTDTLQEAVVNEKRAGKLRKLFRYFSETMANMSPGRVSLMKLWTEYKALDPHAYSKTRFYHYFSFWNENQRKWHRHAESPEEGVMQNE